MKTERIQKNLRYFGVIGALLLATALLYFTWECAKPYADLKDQVFRLHILANSDGVEDQQLKLAVRDDILPAAKEMFTQIDLQAFPGETTAMKTAAAARTMIAQLSDAAQQSVYAHGSTQTAAVMVAYEKFPVKQYADLTMPAGYYWCLKIVLGSGQGKNWWCVLYPPLCISPASAKESFDEAQLELLNQPEKYQFRLAILDWFERWKQHHK